MFNASTIYEKLMRRTLMLLGARSRFIRLDSGERAHLLDIPGSGALMPIVLVHGFSACGAVQYGGLIRQLKSQFSRIIVPDLLGHGESSRPPDLGGEGMLAGLTRTLDVVLPATGAVMFASSMGGGVAVRYVHERPGALRGLVLCSPCGAPLSDEQLCGVVDSFSLHSHAEALAFVDKLFPGGHPFRQIYAWGARQQFRRPHLQRLLRRAGEERLLSPADLRGLSIPTCLLWGQLDTLLPAEHCGFFRRHLPPSAMVETPSDWSHVPFLDHQAELAQRLIRFTRGLAQQPLDQRSGALTSAATSLDEPTFPGSVQPQKPQPRPGC